MGNAQPPGGSASGRGQPRPAGMAEGLAYDYAPCRTYAAALGLRFDEAFLPVADRRFEELGLSQSQVVGVIDLYSWTVNYYWRPSTYTWRQRLGLAAHFLFGKGR